MICSLIIKVIHLYRRAISPFLPPRCRFDPTCSRYAIHALEHHGFRKGSWLILKRLFRCHPFGGWGFDPVPDHRVRTDQPKHN
jgi:putative membrane protein insertion efficiency factor